MIHLDTSVLVNALTGDRPLESRLREVLENGEMISFSALVLFEWRRGPRTTEQLDAQEQLFPASEAIPFGATEATVASELYRQAKRARGREIDIAIAACAIAHDAELWTSNPDDFKDIPNLRVRRS
jgi:predicted nucleic acid-binding protein